MRERLITSDPRVMVGKPVIKGTRITVELIVRELAGGMTIEDILEGYPHLKREQIVAAMKFAAASVHAQRVYVYADDRACA